MNPFAFSHDNKRYHTYADFLEGYRRLRAYIVPVGEHIINGLPGETPSQMVETAQTLATLDLQLVKIHLLHVLENTPLAVLHRAGGCELLSRARYVETVCDQLELFPPHFVLGRLTGDGAPALLLGTQWSRKKLCVLNEIDKELVRRQ